MAFNKKPIRPMHSTKRLSVVLDNDILDLLDELRKVNDMQSYSLLICSIIEEWAETKGLTDGQQTFYE